MWLSTSSDLSRVLAFTYVVFIELGHFSSFVHTFYLLITIHMQFTVESTSQFSDHSLCHTIFQFIVLKFILDLYLLLAHILNAVFMHLFNCSFYVWLPTLFFCLQQHIWSEITSQWLPKSISFLFLLTLPIDGATAIVLHLC